MNQYLFVPVLIRFVFVLLILLESAEKTHATHSMGADLTYQCLGGNTYKLTLSFYRDCYGIPAPPSVIIEVTSVSCGYYLSANGNPIPGTGQEITPICPSDSSTCHGGIFTGIEEWVYEATIVLPAQCADWTFSYSLCCRNQAITTINAPLNEDIYVYSMLNNTVSPCNNSPTFSNKPVPFVCLDQQFCFNHGANDLDGDSLVYSLITPLSFSGLPVTYLSPYSASQPLNSVPPMTFDPSSGDFCITPQSLQVTVMAVLVSEFRNGILIGQVERDLQITVINCNNMIPTLSGINGTNEFTITVCQNELLCFAMYSDDQDSGQTVTMNWNSGVQGGYFNSIGVPHPFGSFCWTPTPAAVATSPHCFTVDIFDDACPYFGSQIYSYCITVIDLETDAGPDLTVNCGGTVNISAATTGAQGTLAYLWSNGFTGPSQQVGPGTYIVTVTDDMCSDEDTIVVTPLAGPLAQFNYQAGCLATPVVFNDGSTTTGGTTISSWNWDFGDGNTSSVQNPSHQYATAGTYTVCLEVTTANGCTDTICQSFTVPTSVTASFIANDVCDGNPVTFTNNSSPGGLNYSWNFGNGQNSTATNPVITFSNSGTYNITLIAGTGTGCPDTTSSTLTVYSIPIADFNITAPSTCQGATINFTDASSGTGNSWEWDFGNGNSSIQQNPSTIYTTPGNYDVILIVTSGDGCVDTISQPVVINPGINSVTSNYSFCTGSNVTLNAGNPGSSYDWTPGGNTSQSISVSDSGQYSVLITDPNGCTGINIFNVTESPIPVASFSWIASCSGNFNFIDSCTISAGTLVGWSWDFGNGNTSSLQNPLFTFTAPGTFPVNLTVTSDSGCTASIINQVTFSDSGNFIDNLNDTSLCGNNIVLLDAGNPGNSYLWSNGSSSSTINVMTNGTYTVTITDAAGCTGVFDAIVQIGDIPSSFFQTTDVCLGITNIFTNSSSVGSGSIVFSQWNFGDGNSSSAVSPSYLFTSPGTYLVQLISITNSGCSDTLLIPVTVFNPPEISLTGDLNICIGDSTLLTASGGISYLWDTGDTLAAIIITPTVTTNLDLTITDANGCMSDSTITVSVNQEPVINIPPAFVCTGNAVILNAGNPGAQYLWNNGITTQTISVTSAGTYTVTVTNPAGCSAIEQVIVSEGGVNPVQHEKWICQDGSIILSGASPGSTYAWLPGGNTTPSITVTDSGQYSVLITDSNGCSGTIIFQVNQLPEPQPGFTWISSCTGSFTFNDQTTVPGGSISNWNWNFGSGINSSLQNPTHIFITPGNYPVSLTVTTDSGCTATATNQVTFSATGTFTDNLDDTALCNYNSHLLDAGNPGLSYLWSTGDTTQVISVNNTSTYSVTITDNSGCSSVFDAIIQFHSIPIATYSVQDACEDDSSVFTNNSTIAQGSIQNCLWIFGDGDSSYLFSPTHFYATPGVYNCQLLVISNHGCVDTLINSVNVNDNPLVQFSVTNSCLNDSSYFNGNASVSSGTISSWLWNFGDGTSGTLPDPAHYYNAPGSYIVRLRVTSSQGCQAVYTDSTTIYPVPVFQVSSDYGCESAPATFELDDTTGIVNVLWDFGDGSSSANFYPVHTYNTHGSYVVSALAENQFGCKAKDSITIILADDPVVSFSANPGCEGSPVSFDNNTTISTGPITYAWNFGDSTLTSVAVNPFHSFNSSGTFQVTLTATSNAGCTGNFTLPVIIYKNPVPGFMPLNAEGCGPLSISFTDQSLPGSGTLVLWEWEFGDGGTAQIPDPVHIYENAGIYDVTLSVSNSKGCTASITLTDSVIVHPKPIALFTPDPHETTVLEPVYFINQSIGATNYTWSFGDGHGSFDPNPHHLYNDSGHYTITLVATNQFNCVAHYEYPIIINPVWTAYIPNSFTPNSDGKNEIFQLYGIGIESFNIEIWNRWGELIYQSNNQGWDGKIINSNEPAKQDVYIYKVDFTTIFGERKNMVGRVTLAR